MRLVNECEGSKGGNLLSQIFILTNTTTDSETIQIYSFLLEKAFIPYIEMMQNWLYLGKIDDIYEEFIVSEKKNVNKENINKEYKDNYWDARFVVNN